MKVYISSHSRWAASYVASALRSSEGFQVTSTWYDGPCKRTAERTDEDRRAGAERNAGQIAGSDALVLIASHDRVPGGKFVEAGIALGFGVPVVVLGHRENNLLWHPRVSVAEDIDGLVAGLRAPARG